MTKTPIGDICYDLIEYKCSSSARLVLFELMENPLIDKITKKFVIGLFTGEPKLAKRAIEILSECNIINFKTGEWIGKPNYDYFTKDEETPSTPLEKFSWRYGQKFHNSFKSYGHLLVTIANSKRYFPEEYFHLLFSEVKKDKFWGKVITEEMLLRKIELLEKQFGSKIPKKVGDLSDVEDIF